MDVRVEVRAEDPRSDEVRKTTSSFLTFVAIDGSGKPTTVPELICEDDAERELQQTATRERREELETLVERLEDE